MEMEEHNPELRRRLESLADTTEGRGAASVLAAARVRAAASGPNLARRNGLLLASVAACVALVATTATVVSQNASSSHRSQQSAHRTTTTTTRSGAARTGERSSSPETADTGTEPTTNSTTTGPTTKPAVTSTTKPPAKTTTTTTNASSNDPSRVRLQSFSSCSSLVDYARSQALQDVGPYGLPGSIQAVSGLINTKTPQAATPTATTATDTSAFSSTNNQEPGVDEPDQVKTDGKRIFSVAQGKLWATSATSNPPKLLDSLAFSNFSASQLLLAGDRLLVIGASAPVAVPGAPQPAALTTTASYFGQARIAIVDVHDATNLTVVDTLTIDGGYVAARMINGVARLVVRSEPTGFAWQYPKDGSDAAQQDAADYNRQLVVQSTAANWVPNLTIADGAGKASPARPLVDCNDALRPAAFSGFGMLSVFTIDPARPDATNATSVFAGGDLVYASPTALYVSTTAWDHIDSGTTVRYGPDTIIHKFDITNPAGAQYKVSGRVPGTALSQYSFSELDGRLRVATTATDPSSTQSYVTVLADDGKALSTVGQVAGIGKGQRIYAVRFIGTTAYVVTFRQTDPLYVIDLSDPTKPTVVGTLEVLGYSAYLHPISDNLLLGVGQDATDQGRRLGTQVSVFDVSDPSNPKLLQKVALGQGQSSVEFDPHAFLWWPATRLAVLPVSLFSSQGGQTFVGAIGLTAGATQLSEAGRITQPPQQANNPATSPVIERSVVIGSSVFTLSEQGLLQSDLTTLAPGTWVPFA
jgi:uncharacterized secreted protein with C-terminal beta-propeller domain